MSEWWNSRHASLSTSSNFGMQVQILSRAPCVEPYDLGKRFPCPGKEIKNDCNF